ncbi:hypothetical protein POSPLADRAFT_1038968 [Postia placenta MAD-698-R-SB12]|uniref:Zinc-ribbon 15 domain-containing protein n=1 Tax=Postia placenta MAD-698-R-SB12 TaxID=670580 RepID=A0A1X6N966_9APHY|nr:hypothetical protein POSPLADRAFT_1038968 [Postia placenta MAD-698-R-SB12]OSX65179.1 hypothetical protein POSPLADRAFT_1038968 [Postia placenta MAD-698-R-SB12]
MDFIFCLPIIFGCPTRIKPDGDQTPRVCPRCNNASVTSAKSRLWFELCWVPLIPMRSERVWMCSICQWRVPIQPGWEPAVPNYNFQPGRPNQWQPPPSGYMAPPPNAYQPGYQPGYTSETTAQSPKPQA